MAYTSEIEKLERRHQENPKGRTFAILADHYRKAGEVDRAVALLREGLEVHPDYPSALIVLGRCHLDRNDYRAAEEPFRHVLQIDAENGIALKAMADIAEQEGRPGEAREWLETLLSIDGTNEGAREQLARVSGVESPAPVEVDPILAEGFGPEFSEAMDADVEPTAFEGGLGRAAEPVWNSDELERDEPLEVEEDAAEALDGLETSGGIDASRLEIEPEEQGLPDPAAPFGADLDIGVERADEIVLRSTGSTEFQVASAAEDLGSILEPPVAGDQTGAAEDLDSTLEPPTPGEESRPVEVDGESAAAEEPEPDLGDALPAFEENAVGPVGSNWWDPAQEEPVETGEERLSDTAPLMEAEDHEGAGEEEQALEEGALDDLQTGSWYDAFGTAEASAEPAARPPEDDEKEAPGAEPAPGEAGSGGDEWPAEAALPSDEPVPAAELPVAEPPSVAEPAPQADRLPDPAPAFGITETLAEIYIAQGHHQEAILVYRQLLERNPESERLQEKLTTVEALVSRPARSDRRSYSAGESGGTSIGGYFAGILASRPAPADAPPPARPESGEDEARPGAAAPTRPATDPLSLSAIFGEEGAKQGGGSAPPPEPPVGAPPAAPGLRFDEFFDAPPAAGTRPADDDDLSQFHDWLKSLKS